MTREEVTMLVQRVLKDAQFGMPQLAEAEKLNYGTLRQWAMGNRTPTAENLRKIAEGLRNHGARLSRLAEDLERAADRDEAA